MTTLTIKINKKTKSGKAIFDLLTEMSKDGKAVKVIESEDESPYNPEFVKKIKDSYENDERYELKSVDELWQSL